MNDEEKKQQQTSPATNPNPCCNHSDQENKRPASDDIGIAHVHQPAKVAENLLSDGTPVDLNHEASCDSQSQRALINFKLESADAGDVVLNTGHKQFCCHKKVLTKHSIYFRAMFQSGMKESHSSVINLGDIDSHSFHLLLQYFYSGKLDLNQETVEGLTEVSSQFQFQEVLDQCCELLLEMVDDDLCLGLMRLANRLTLVEVYNQSRVHALWHFTSVRLTEDFFTASLTMVVNYLQDEHLNIDSETEVFIAACEWYLARTPNETGDLIQFFGNVVNFHLMSSKEVSSLKELPVVESNQLLKDFVAGLDQEVLAQLNGQCSNRVRTSPKDGRILCVGAHQCSLSHCGEKCAVAGRETGPLEVLEFLPESCRLRAFSLLPGDYQPSLALDCGYRACAVGQRVYVAGGETSLGRVGGWLTAVWYLDTLRATWHLATSLTDVRRHHGMCAHQTALYLVGGIGRFRKRLVTVESFDTVTEQWTRLPSLLQQETSPAVTVHAHHLYVFKNYAQAFSLRSHSWTLLELRPHIPGLPLCAYPCPSSPAILVSCFNSKSLWKVDVDARSCQLLANFQRECGGGVLRRGAIYHFQLCCDKAKPQLQVETFRPQDKTLTRLGALQGAVLTPSHFVTVPAFPRYAPSSSALLD